MGARLQTTEIPIPLESQTAQQLDAPAWMRPDEFFTEAQIVRLRELMRRFQIAEKPPEEVLTAEEYAELIDLIDAEFWASGQRAIALSKGTKG